MFVAVFQYSTIGQISWLSWYQSYDKSSSHKPCSSSLDIAYLSILSNPEKHRQNVCNATFLIRIATRGLSLSSLLFIFVIDRMVGDECTLDAPIRLLLMFAMTPTCDIATSEAIMGEKSKSMRICARTAPELLWLQMMCCFSLRSNLCIMLK
eukprot:scaffold14050_cov163-Cylindrotheca_fusiformis.AAC.4